ncbi:hypothetical protein C5Y93_14100 [Blastopirellula marina]|uniref:Uncharacterized protein n=1 Tax=Blastopirellula marina TaxID=124 RepID=A0A2S8GMB9_9BACT|nr:hypothetical protein C5Y93_14100 [Blastopirellula marina]
MRAIQGNFPWYRPIVNEKRRIILEKCCESLVRLSKDYLRHVDIPLDVCGNPFRVMAQGPLQQA